ncbi:MULTISPECIES: hypothetical protein [unclassified Bradyrhizobium]|uniref:hypothetical protein n=1 Tax=unclassified Bradyrhizobium TaxID=2631580 RepID=UPI001FFBE2E6|nr:MULTISPECIES: hypothetical protein [unclassified Bradyrhizobium]
MNCEGNVSKRVDAPYRSERVEAWQKIKTVQREKFAVVALVKDPTGVAALYLGKQEGNELRYMGKVWAEAGRNRRRSARRLIRSCPEAKNQESHKEAEGHLGRAEVLPRHCRTV